MMEDNNTKITIAIGVVLGLCVLGILLIFFYNSGEEKGKAEVTEQIAEEAGMSKEEVAKPGLFSKIGNLFRGKKDAPAKA